VTVDGHAEGHSLSRVAPGRKVGVSDAPSSISYDSASSTSTRATCVYGPACIVAPGSSEVIPLANCLELR
jgi:hypothetical protein